MFFTVAAMGADQPDPRQSPWRSFLPAAWRWLDWLAPVPIFITLFFVLFAITLEEQRSFEHPVLLLGLNLVFATLVALVIAAWAGRLVLTTCRPGILLLGSGALIWGLSGCIGVVAGFWSVGSAPFNANALVTIHNISVWFAALCHLAGASLSFKPYKEGGRPWLSLMIAYSSALGLIGFITHAALQGWIPPFFQPGEGGTDIRQLVLGSAMVMFFLTAVLLQVMHQGSPFARWYSLALYLLAIGLFGVLLQKTTGSFMGWTGRFAQYLGGLYMLVAVLLGKSGQLVQVDHPDRHSQDGIIQHLLQAIALAVLSTSSAVAVRLFFLHDLGFSLSYLTFFPAVMLVAFIGGLVPAIVATFLSVILVLLFWTEPVGRIVISDLESLTEAALFIGSGLAIAFTAQVTKQAQVRAITAEGEARLAEERVKSAEALHTSEDRLARVIEATEVGIWDWQVQTGEVVVNEHWAAMAGYTLDELQPVSIQTWIDLVHPEDYLRSEAQLAEVFAGTRPLYSIDCRIRHRQGGWVWIQDRGKVVEWTAEGKPVRMTGFHIDITARKLAEERVSTLMHEMATIVETTPIGIVKVIDRRLVWSNRAIEEMLGYSKEELVCQPTKAFFASSKAYEAMEENAYPLLAQGSVYETELAVRCKDGTRRITRCTGRMIVPEAFALGSIWAVEDITERKAMEEAARERVTLYHDLFAKNLTVNLLVDPSDGSISDANAAAEAFYGYNRERLLTMQIGDINIASAEETREAIALAVQQHKEPFHARHRLATGELRDVEVYTSPINIGGRTLLHTIVFDVTRRRLLEQTLREQQKLLHSMTEGTSDAIYIKDWAGRYLMCNSATARYLGMPVESVLGKDDRVFFSPEDAHQIMEGDRRVLESGAVQTYEEHLTMDDGHHTFLSTKGPVRNVNGSVVGLFGIARDITGRKRMEEELRARDATQTAIIENQPGLVWLKDCDGRFLAVNSAFAKACMKNHPAEVIGLRDLDLWPEELAEKYMADDQAVLRTGTPLNVVEPVVDQGMLKWFETFKAPIFDAKGVAIGTTGYARDITERRQNELLLRENEERLSAATLAANLGVFTYTLNGSKTFFSPEFHALTGLSPGSSLRLNLEGVLRIVHPDDQTRFVDLVNDAYRPDGPGTMDFDHRVVRDDGQIRWLRVVGRVFFTGTGEQRRADRAVGIVQDITERKRMEQELEQSRQTAVAADQAKSRLLATVAHEFRTPLSLLTSSLDIIDRYGQFLGQTQLDQQNTHIRNAARHLTALAETVLTYRTMGIDALQADPQPCIIVDLCRTIAEETRVAWSQEHAFRVALQLAEDDILLMDGLLFRRIVANLLANAFQYTPAGGEVIFEARREADSLLLSVADRGIGMELEDLDRIFTAFYRGRNVGSRRGVGLGLNIVHDTVGQLGGTITVTSTIGAGTTFVVTLPWREVEE